MLKPVIKEPLLHFLLIAAAFFMVYALVNPVFDDEVIEVSEGRIGQLRNHFYRTWQREPTAGELQALVNEFVLDEIYVREARALGLDDNDEIVRRRLRQKMEVLAIDALEIDEPDDATLEAFLQSQVDKFAAPSRYSFTQVYVSTDGDAAVWQAHITLQQQRIQQGLPPEGDVSLLPVEFMQATAFDVARQFGDAFAPALDALPLNQWAGPVPSGLGMHFVYLADRQPGQLPPLQAIRNKVLAEWQYQQRQARMAEQHRSLLQRYRVQVAWPAEVR